MLDSLHIQNYRLFKDLKIDKLGQVNLIAGKNNTGKTALLEALRIMIAATNETICNILYSRGDYYPNDTYIFQTIFPNKDYKNRIIQFDFFYNKKEERIKIKYGNQKRKYSFFLLYELPVNTDEAHELEVINNPQEFDRNADFIFFSFQNNENLISELWKKVSLTPKEDEVVEIMKIIDTRILKVRVDDRKSRVLLNGDNEPIPLKNLGDGANRLFTIALALVNAKDKILLIDEFEVGLHHSVQEQLWDIIFKYAKEWNIQVFATTHSQDTVEKFYYVANKPKNEGIGKYFTLNKNGEDIVAVDYDMEEIKLALESNIEIR